MSQMNMKNVILALSMMSFLFFGCQGTVDPTVEDPNNNQSNTEDLKGSITLYADKKVINAEEHMFPSFQYVLWTHMARNMM